jgi:hypothetical protein
LFATGLLEALKPVDGQILPLKPVFLLDPWFVKNGRVGANRWRFLIQSLQAVAFSAELIEVDQVLLFNLVDSNLVGSEISALRVKIQIRNN